jgi:Ase1/PRC1/MAP65 family protein
MIVRCRFELTASSEKHELTEECHRLITTIKQMETSLEDPRPRTAYEADDPNLQVTYPLKRCMQGLKEKYNVVHKEHKQRFEDVKSERA